MKFMLTAFLSFSFSAATFASEFAAFKDLYDRGIAPASTEAVKTFLGYETKCLGKDKQEIAHDDVFVIEEVLVKKSMGPAFPEQKVEAILLGKSKDKQILGMKYKSTLEKDALKLETMKTVLTEECSWDSDYCYTKVSSEKSAIVNVRMNGEYLVYNDVTNGVYGYCW